MNLVAFSIKTKGGHNFSRRLWTVFTRFGFSEARTRRALYTLIDTLRAYKAAPTFFIPAVVLRRHPELITEVCRDGAEIGIHGYVHNDYRYLSGHEQLRQTRQAISVFQNVQLPYQGFRNPYLGWTEETLHVFHTLGFAYESNEAITHDVIDPGQLSPLQRIGYKKSLALFQAITPSAYTLRPHFEGTLLRIPTSIPDDEMLFDRLRITDPLEVGRIWCDVMQSVYDYAGIYTLNLHPERGLLCKQALEILLHYAHSRPYPVWLARLDEVAQWWKERSQFRLKLSSLTPGSWSVEAFCTPRATLFLGGQRLSPTGETAHRHYTVHASKCPAIALSLQTPAQVMDFLHEQGHAVVRASQEEAQRYSLYLDIPEALGTTRDEQRRRCSELLTKIEQLDVPLLHFGYWPDNYHAALAISGDIDSVTVQDFFLRVLEVRQGHSA